VCRLEVLFSEIPKPGAIHVPKLVDALSRVQDSLYVIGNYLLREPYKEAGRRSKPLMTHCTLILNGLSSGSTVAELEVLDSTPSLIEGEAPLGVRCLGIMDEIIKGVLSEEDPTEAVSKSIGDARYRSRVAQELYGLWPSEKEGGIQIRIGKGVKRNLIPDCRPRIEKLIGGPETSSEKSVVGPVIKVNLIRKNQRSLTIWTPQGMVNAFFGPEMIENVRKNVGSVVEIKGRAELDGSGSIQCFRDIRLIERMKELKIDKLEWEDSAVDLKEPLSVAVDVDLANRTWTLENEFLGMISVGENWDDAFSQFQEEFFFLRDNYLKAPDAELTPAAIQLKNRLKSVVE